MALAVLSAYWVLVRIGKRTGYDSGFISEMLTIIMIFAVVGARTGYVTEHWSEYAADPVEIFMVQHGGLMFYGGLIGSWIAVTVYALLRRRSVLQIYDMCVTALPLGHAIGRIGCFFNGCCYGRLSDCPIAISFPRNSFPWSDQLRQGLIGPAAAHSLPVLPSQLFEATLDLVLFAVLFALYARPRRRVGMNVAVYALGYAFIRFVTELSRADERLHVGVLSIGQIISLGIFSFGIGLFIFLSVRKNKPRY